MNETYTTTNTSGLTYDNFGNYLGTPGVNPYYYLYEDEFLKKIADQYNKLVKSAGSFERKEEKKVENPIMKNLQVKSIKYEKNKENKNYTTVTWNDGTKTTVRCSDNDEYSRYDGFCSALAKKIFGTSSQVRKIVETKDEAIEIAKKKAEQEEQNRLAEIKRNRKMRHQIKYRAKQIVVEKEAKKLAKEMMGE